MPGARIVLLALGAALVATLVTLVGLPPSGAPSPAPACPARASTSSLVAGRALARAATEDRPGRPSVLPARRDGTRGRRADAHGALPDLASPRAARRAPAPVAVAPATAPTRMTGGSIAARAPPRT